MFFLTTLCSRFLDLRNLGIKLSDILKFLVIFGFMRIMILKKIDRYHILQVFTLSSLFLVFAVSSLTFIFCQSNIAQPGTIFFDPRLVLSMPGLSIIFTCWLVSVFRLSEFRFSLIINYRLMNSRDFLVLFFLLNLRKYFGDSIIVKINILNDSFV
jgi:hypothetical protein